ncbi:hypothetical protein A6R68_00054 [Neotoma lepida]|uniref:Uncharacterized protein n=1 Tax=Neotoma lepida TaxID=56216 RepID=A0A1A6GYL5_NEOLE|nr:hypothetical protein A6R68_00054 [Neotoma lepida]
MEASSLSFLHLGGRPASSDTKSDSEEESQDGQLKIIVLGDGISEKTSLAIYLPINMKASMKALHQD